MWVMRHLAPSGMAFGQGPAEGGFPAVLSHYTPWSRLPFGSLRSALTGGGALVVPGGRSRSMKGGLHMLSAKLTNAQRKAIYRRDGFRCALCDSTKYIQLHHIISRGGGGTDHPHNLITLCADCHAAAHGMMLREWPDVTEEAVEQAIVEYMSDLYAEQGHVWNPYRNPLAKRAPL